MEKLTGGALTQVMFLLKKRGIFSLIWRIVFFILNRTKNLFDILNCFFYKNGVIPVNGSLMKLNPRDKGLSKDLRLYKKREHFSTDFMKEFIKEDDIIIDIGANIGYYALLEAKLAKKGRVYAIEPVPESRKILEENIKLNGYNNISVYPYAISNKNGTNKMYVYDKKNWSSFIKNSSWKIVQEVQTNTIKLDDFIRYCINKKPQVIRMDTEGHEYEIISGMQKTLDSKIPLKLFIEFHPKFMSTEKIEKIIYILKRAGVRVKRIFIESTPSNYNNLKIFNKLNKKMGFLEFGEFKETNLDSLKTILLKGHINGMFYFPEVFLERS